MFGWMTRASSNAPAKVCERLMREMRKQPRNEQERVLDALIYEMRQLAPQAGEQPATRHEILTRLNYVAEQRRAVMREGHTSESDPQFAKAALVEAYYEALLRDKPAIERIVRASRDWSARLGMQASAAAKEPPARSLTAMRQVEPSASSARPEAPAAETRQACDVHAGERQALRRSFDRALALVQRSQAEQLAAAHAVDLMHTRFVARFASLATFRGADWCERSQYLSALVETAKAIICKIGVSEGRGAYLHSIYLWAVHVGDAELEQHTRSCLDGLTRLIPRGRSQVSAADCNRSMSAGQPSRFDGGNRTSTFRGPASGRS